MTTYSPEVWETLKNVWESSPKITWQKLVDMVGIELDCEMPSPSVVRRRSITGKWKQKSKSLVKNNAKKINKTIKDLTSELYDQDTENDEESDGQESVKNVSNLTVFSHTSSGQKNQSQKKILTDQLNAARVIRDTRIQAERLGYSLSNCFDALEGLHEELININLSQTSEEQAKSIQFRLQITTEIVEQNFKQGNTLKNLAQIRAMFWGLELGDLKDLVTINANRSSHSISSKVKLEAQARTQAGKREAYMRKLQMVEAGEYFEADDVVAVQ